MKKNPNNIMRHCITLDNASRQALQSLKAKSKSKTSYSKIIRDLLNKAYKPQ